MKEIVRFHFSPIEGEDDCGADVFVKMLLPQDGQERKKKPQEIEDGISSYIEGRDCWSFEELALDVARSFDSGADIVHLPFFMI